MAKIITKSNPDEIVSWITDFASRSPTSPIRIEGVCGCGKTTIARKLAASGIGVHVDFDKFATKRPKPTPYAQCLRTEDLENELTNVVKFGKTVILDAVCLEEVAPVERWGRGLKIYIKQLSFNSVDPIWPVGFHLEDEPPAPEPHRSVHLYHLSALPHMNADLIVEFPEYLHQLSTTPFSRERCFDPPNSVIVG